MPLLTLDALNALSPADVIARFGAVYEHSPWVAEQAAAARPVASLTALHRAMVAAVDQAGEAAHLALLRAHPDLAGRAALAGDVAEASRQEQASAGLDSLTPEELAQFTAYNTAYQDRFGFPFILAVKHWGKAHILAAFQARLGNEAEQERRTALAEVHKIAFLRLLDLVQPAPSGRLTTHVLDTAQGRPAAGMAVELARLGADGSATVLKRLRTNADGRLDSPALAPEEMAAGRYQLTFFAGEYFLASGQTVTAPAFLDVIPLRFAIANPEEHHHVPLLVSPWSYSTYRGS